MKVEWTQEMSVGDEVIDSQHKKLLRQINELKEEIARGGNVDTLRGTIDFLDKYVREHLSYEEEHMRKNNYPDFKEHVKIHQKFIDYFKKFKEEFDACYHSDNFSLATIKNLSSNAEKFLEEWLVNHMLKGKSHARSRSKSQ